LALQTPSTQYGHPEAQSVLAPQVAPQLPGLALQTPLLQYGQLVAQLVPVMQGESQPINTLIEQGELVVWTLFDVTVTVAVFVPTVVYAQAKDCEVPERLSVPAQLYVYVLSPPPGVASQVSGTLV
jgi:hypothetical protein